MRKRSGFRFSTGFTFLEMVLSLSLILILCAMLLPLMAGGREAARRTACESNLKQLTTAAHLYAQDYGGNLPASLDAAQPYIKNYGVQRCPSQPGPSARASTPPPPDWSSYLYRGGLSNDDAGVIPLLRDRDSWHGDGLNVGLLDGRVRWFKAADAPALDAPIDLTEAPR
jgi:prepilin-type processing-associated H-X9-DG protein